MACTSLMETLWLRNREIVIALNDENELLPVG